MHTRKTTRPIGDVYVSVGMRHVFQRPTSGPNRIPDNRVGAFVAGDFTQPNKKWNGDRQCVCASITRLLPQGYVLVVGNNQHESAVRRAKHALIKTVHEARNSHSNAETKACV